jgi:hypothetical protein
MKKLLLTGFLTLGLQSNAIAGLVKVESSTAQKNRIQTFVDTDSITKRGKQLQYKAVEVKEADGKIFYHIQTTRVVDCQNYAVGKIINLEPIFVSDEYENLSQEADSLLPITREADQDSPIYQSNKFVCENYGNLN